MLTRVLPRALLATGLWCRKRQVTMKTSAGFGLAWLWSPSRPRQWSLLSTTTSLAHCCVLPLRRVVHDQVDNAIANALFEGRVQRRDTIVLKAGGGIEIEKAAEL